MAITVCQDHTIAQSQRVSRAVLAEDLDLRVALWYRRNGCCSDRHTGKPRGEKISRFKNLFLPLHKMLKASARSHFAIAEILRP
jgi:hypothetical protein